jgi:hypothetical protein
MKMEPENKITCGVNADLMLLYNSGRTSPETNRAIEEHIANCPACAQAFAREPEVRKNVPLKHPTTSEGLDNTLDWLKYRLLPLWGFVLYLGSRGLALLDRPLRRIGVPTHSLKIRLYRARRKVAGKLTEEQVSAAPAA